MKLLLALNLATTVFAEQPRVVALKAARMFDRTSDGVVNDAVTVKGATR